MKGDDTAITRSSLFDGSSPVLAWACEGSAEILVQRDEPGDREKAIELRDEALTIAQVLDMRPLSDRILAQGEMLRT